MRTMADAIDLFRRGFAFEAQRVCESRLESHADDVDALSLLAEICSSTARNERALPLLERMAQLRADDAAAHRRLAACLLALHHLDRAVESLRTAIRLEPKNTRAHNNLGQAYVRLGRVAEAIGCYGESVRLDPRYAIGHCNLGLALLSCGEPQRAVESFEAAISVAPELIDAWVGRGLALAELRRSAQALECYDTALRLRPGDPSLSLRKASVLLDLERAGEALDYAQTALRVAPDSAEAHTLRAAASRRLGRRTEALLALDTALGLRSDDAEAWCHRGMILHELGQVAAAVAAYRRAVTLAPDNLQARSRLLSRLIPPVALSEKEIESARQAFETEMTDFRSFLHGKTLDFRAALLLSQQQFFYLSYQEQSNRMLLEPYRKFCVESLAASVTCPAPRRTIPAAVSDAQSQRLQIGFVSAHVHDHSVFHAIQRGWLQHLDHERFELVVFSLGSKHDEMTRLAHESADHFDMTSRSVTDWARVIRDRDLDALIYPEIGMNEPTLALASLRLARRQYAAWGHPETSGLPTVDGYLSAELFEPPDAQDHYTERLIRLPNLGVHCLPYETSDAGPDLESLGIDRRRIVFVCPGVPFKYRPQDDRILVEIGCRLERCTFVFFRHEVAELSLLLERRLADAFLRAGLDPSAFLRWIPWQPRTAFLGLLRQADVYLDTLGFSGFNTMMQAVECHLPSVTLDGRFMRGRLGGGILRRMGLSDAVSTTPDEYIDAAVRLGASAAERSAMRESLRRAGSIPYSDLDAIRGLSTFLSNELRSSVN